MRWLVRYFRLRARVRALARRMQAFPGRCGYNVAVSAEQLAEIGRALEGMLDGEGG